MQEFRGFYISFLTKNGGGRYVVLCSACPSHMIFFIQKFANFSGARLLMSVLFILLLLSVLHF